MRISNRLDKHLAAAVTAAAGIAASSNAAIVAWENCNLVIPATFAGLYINVEAKTSGGSQSGVPGWDINPYGASALTFFHAAGGGYATNGGSYAASLAIGTTIGATSSFGGNFGTVTFGTAANNWSLNAVNYFGFQFLNSAGATRYAYGTMLVGASATTRTITNLYYEDTGGAITVVPAPGVIAMLGLAGVVGRRRR